MRRLFFTQSDSKYGNWDLSNILHAPLFGRGAPHKGAERVKTLSVTAYAVPALPEGEPSREFLRLFKKLQFLFYYVKEKLSYDLCD